MKLIATAKSKPVEFLCSLAMIGAGAYLTIAGANGTATPIAGTILTTLGGALLSWSTVSLTSKEAAAEILQPQLAAIARQLVTVSGQISKTMRDARTGEVTTDAALELVGQATRILYASVNEIHVVLGEKVNPEELLETAQRVEQLAAQLADGTGAEQAEQQKSELAAAVADLRRQVEEVAVPHHRGAAILERAHSNCPVCQTPTHFSLGVAKASSAMPICPSCGERFHAHRLGDGSVTARRSGLKKPTTPAAARPPREEDAG